MRSLMKGSWAPRVPSESQGSTRTLARRLGLGAGLTVLRTLRSPEVIIYGAHPVCCGNEPIHLQNALDFAEHAKTLVPGSSISLSLFLPAVIVTVLLASSCLHTTQPCLCVESSILNPKPFSERLELQKLALGGFGFTITCTVLTPRSQNFRVQVPRGTDPHTNHQDHMGNQVATSFVFTCIIIVIIIMFFFFVFASSSSPPSTLLTAASGVERGGHSARRAAE